MKKSLKIVFFGNESLATGVESNPVVLKALVYSGYEVCAVVVHERQSTSRKAKKVATIEYANEQKIPLFNPDKPVEIIDELKALKADVGVLVAYGRIIPQEIIDIFPHGIINLHPSLLPKLRGSTPIETAILEGLSETGVSIMGLVSQMDAGPIYIQEKLFIQKGTTKQDLAHSLHELGVNNLINVLDNLADFEKQSTDQAESDATFSSMLTKSDGLVDWSQPAEIIERKIRAYSGWPGSWTTINGIRFKITSAKVDDIPIECDEWIIYDSALYIASGDKKYLRIERLQPENKKEMPIQAFLTGYGDRLMAA
jgi:methionyl-tRNA formyltransferase